MGSGPLWTGPLFQELTDSDSDFKGYKQFLSPRILLKVFAPSSH